MASSRDCLLGGAEQRTGAERGAMNPTQAWVSVRCNKMQIGALGAKFIAVPHGLVAAPARFAALNQNIVDVAQAPVTGKTSCPGSGSWPANRLESARQAQVHDLRGRGIIGTGATESHRLGPGGVQLQAPQLALCHHHPQPGHGQLASCWALVTNIFFES